MTARADLEAMADVQADRYRIPKAGFRALILQESGWNPLAVSPSGALGLGQLLGGTLSDMGEDPDEWSQPEVSLRAGAKYLRWLRDRLQNWSQVLAAYNWGIGNLSRSSAVDADGRVLLYRLPQETGHYVLRLAPSFGEVISDDASGPPTSSPIGPLIGVLALALLWTWGTR